jgi:DNA-binding transcriptional LysR family regulator
MISASPRRLAVFKAVVDCGGINAAADHLEISQPSVSAHIRALEAQVGSPLFARRRGRTNQTTTIGQAIYTYACQSLDKSREMDLELRKLQRGEKQGFLLGSQRNFTNHVLPAHLADFLQQHPEARISVHSETQDALIRMLASSVFDVCLLLGYGDAPDFHAEVVGSEQLVIIASPEHSLSGKKQIDPAVLSEYPFVAGLETSYFFRLTRESLRQVGVIDYPVALHLQDTVAVKQAVKLKVGVACTMASAVESEVEKNELVILDVAAPLIRVPVICLYRKEERLPEIAKTFVDYLKTKKVFGQMPTEPIPYV